MPAGSPVLLEGIKMVGAPDQPPGKVGPLDPPVPPATLCRARIHESSPWLEVATVTDPDFTHEISQPQALELTTDPLCQGEAVTPELCWAPPLGLGSIGLDHLLGPPYQTLVHPGFPRLLFFG